MPIQTQTARHRLVYAAAVLDAKACLSSAYTGRAERYRLEIVVTSKYRAVCEHLRDTFGVGTVRAISPVSWKWRVYDDHARAALQRALPYLQAQHDTALLLLEFQDQFITPKARKTK